MAMKVPKPERAVIAAHEAGMHDRKPTPATCRDCARIAALDAAESHVPAGQSIVAVGLPGELPHVFVPVKPRPGKPADPGSRTRTIKVTAPKTKRVYTGKTTTTGDAELIEVPVETPKVLSPAKERKSTRKSEVPVFVPETTVDRYDPATVPAGPSREAWLQAAVQHLRIDFTEAGFPIPEQVRVSVGWPGGRGKKAGVIGQCWPQSMASDALHAIFISPVLTDRIKVLGVLVHELVHASVEKASAHRGQFVKAAKHIGLTPKWTATGESPELVERLTIIADILGDYNHGGLTNLGRQAVQPTRMLKVECPNAECRCILRMTEKWLVQAGTPTCGCGTQMVRGDGAGEGE